MPRGTPPVDGRHAAHAPVPPPHTHTLRSLCRSRPSRMLTASFCVATLPSLARPVRRSVQAVPEVRSFLRANGLLELESRYASRDLAGFLPPHAWPVVYSVILGVIFDLDMTRVALGGRPIPVGLTGRPMPTVSTAPDVFDAPLLFPGQPACERASSGSLSWQLTPHLPLAYTTNPPPLSLSLSLSLSSRCSTLLDRVRRSYPQRGVARPAVQVPGSGGQGDRRRCRCHPRHARRR